MAQSGRYLANAVTLLSNVAATGNFMEVEGGVYQLHAEATWGGTTLTLDAQGPNDTTIAVPGSTLTANSPGTLEFRFSKGERVRAALAGGSGTGFYVRLVKAQD